MLDNAHNVTECYKQLWYECQYLLCTHSHLLVDDAPACHTIECRDQLWYKCQYLLNTNLLVDDVSA